MGELEESIQEDQVRQNMQLLKAFEEHDASLNKQVEFPSL